MAPAAWDSQSPLRDASGGRPALLRGSAFNGWTRDGTTAAEAASDTRGLEPPVRPRKHGSEVKSRHSGAPGGRRAGHSARGASARCQMLPSAFRRSAPSHCEGRKVLGEGRKRTADPEARLRASSPRYGRPNNGDDDARLCRSRLIRNWVDASAAAVLPMGYLRSKAKIQCLSFIGKTSPKAASSSTVRAACRATR